MRLLQEKFPNELIVVSVHSGKFNTEKSTAAIREAILRHGVNHPVVNDADFRVWQSYAVSAWPTVVLIDPRGKIVHTQAGEILAEEFVPKIETLINEAESQGILDRTPLELHPERMVEPARPLNYPSRLLLAGAELLYVSDTGHHRILEVQLSENRLKGEIVRVFGNGQPGLKDGSITEAMFHAPRGLGLRENTLYVADSENHAIRAIDLAKGQVRTVAGTGRKAHGRFQIGKPVETPLRSPWSVCVIDRYLFIAMAGSHQIWVLVDEEKLGVFAGNGREALVDGPVAGASFNQPSDLAVGFGYLFVADSEASAIRAISLDEDPQVITLAGQGLFEFGDVDGTGPEVRLQHPVGLTFYVDCIYIADSYNHKLKTLDPTTGEVKTLLGAGRPGHADGPFDRAELFEPEGVISEEQGWLYIADTNNHLIRVANLATREVHTLMLKGLEKLATVSAAGVPAPAHRLEPVTVSPGEVEVQLDIVLPEGYKLNAEAPQMVETGLGGSGRRHTFGPENTPTWRMQVEADGEVDLLLTLYYCETGDQRLCMIHRARLALPFIVKDGVGTHVKARYEVPL